ncbi:MAG: hypothetical protein AB7O67_11455 [Vicinamibacterales bacterium]
MEPNPTNPRLENPDVAHEASDVSLGGILAFMAVLIISGAIIHALTGLFFMDLRGPGAAEGGRAVPFLTGASAPPPATSFRGLGGGRLPVQQVAPRVDLQDLRQHERRTLRAWGWQDTPFGVRLPVDRALQALEADGQPVEREDR